MATLALLAFALLSAPLAATQSGLPTLSPRPPVPLAPASTNPSPTTGTTTATTGTTSGPANQLPKTGLEAWLVVVIGLGLALTGAVLRWRIAGLAARGRG